MVLNDAMDAMTEALLVFAARRDHLRQVIAPALERGEVVVCDRFTDSTFAYQGGGRGFDWTVLSTLEQWVQGPLEPSAALMQPALTLWFDLPASVAADRLASARTPDKFESQSVQFFEKVANGYAQRLATDPGRFVRIEANQAASQVWLAVLAAVRHKGFLS
jgi:dTMP kinase